MWSTCRRFIPLAALSARAATIRRMLKPGDEGSPWAIGSADGGHKAIHSELGTLEDFRHFVQKAKELDLSVAMDIAFQAAPDHPYVREHEAWFRKRPDGTIQYAENPPKKYQDIYPFDFESNDWEGMWEELKSVFLYWIDQGVTIFRVDNPHTKAFPFWEWAIAEIKRDNPEVLFLAEAFTRPKIMYRLAKLGFSQSYTYFPWRNAKDEITAYLTELTQTPVREFFRPNQWPNTPDILTEFLADRRSCRRLRFAFCWRLRWARTTESTVPPLSCWNIVPYAMAAKNISIRRSTRFAIGTLTRQTVCDH